MKELMRGVKSLAKEECGRGINVHGYFNTDHEALGVIWEEVTECNTENERIKFCFDAFMETVFNDLDELKHDRVSKLHDAAVMCACEAIQVAAMCKKWFEGKDMENE